MMRSSHFEVIVVYTSYTSECEPSVFCLYRLCKEALVPNEAIHKGLKNSSRTRLLRLRLAKTGIN